MSDEFNFQDENPDGWTKLDDAKPAPRPPARLPGRNPGVSLAEPTRGTGTPRTTPTPAPKRDVKIKLGKKTYTVQKLTLLKSEAWTQGFLEGPMKELLGNFTGMAGLDFEDPGAIEQMITGIQNLLSQYIRVPLEELARYCPDIEADMDTVLETAYNDEVLQGFMEVLQLEFPLEQIRAMFTGSRGFMTTRN